MSKPNVGILATKDWVTSLINKVIKKGFNGYSTDEKRIGTWIDGKPIYRKILQNQIIPATPTDGIVTLGPAIDLSSYNIDTFLDSSLVMKTSVGNVLGKGQTISCGGTDNKLYAISSIYIASTKELHLYNNRVSWNDQPIVTIILEYTKTTD